MDTPCVEYVARTGAPSKYARLKVAGQRIQITHLLWHATYGQPVPPDKQINHHCDNPACFRIDHLYLGTPKENTADMMRRKRDAPRPIGEDQWSAKLTEADVREIRDIYPQGNITHQELADKYGVSRLTVGRVLWRQTWKHVE